MKVHLKLAARSEWYVKAARWTSLGPRNHSAFTLHTPRSSVKATFHDIDGVGECGLKRGGPTSDRSGRPLRSLSARSLNLNAIYKQAKHNKLTAGTKSCPSIVGRD